MQHKYTQTSIAVKHPLEDVPGGMCYIHSSHNHGSVNSHCGIFMIISMRIPIPQKTSELALLSISLSHISSFILLWHPEMSYVAELFSNQLINKANLRDLIAATGLVILLKLDSNRRFFSRETPNLGQNRRFFLAEWPWNLTDDHQKQ